MNTQLHEAFGIVAGRIHATEDAALLRTVQLSRRAERRARRTGGLRRAAR